MYLSLHRPVFTVEFYFAGFVNLHAEKPAYISADNVIKKSVTIDNALTEMVEVLESEVIVSFNTVDISLIL